MESTAALNSFPAMCIIATDIETLLNKCGIYNVHVRLTYIPTWTTDLISDATKEKLKQYGIAPPQHSLCNTCVDGKAHQPACPLCNSTDTKLISQFGSTACKALYKCNSCQEPFDYFKCH